MSHLKQTNKDNTMLTINEALQIKPVFILAVNYDAGSLGEMLGEPRDLNIYLAEMTIQYHSLVSNSCLAFTVECLVSVNDGIVTIDEMNASSDSQSVYANNIAELTSIDGNNINIYQDGLSDTMQDFLIELIENQPIYEIPTHYTIEAY